MTSEGRGLTPCTCTNDCHEDGEMQPDGLGYAVTATWIDHSIACRCVPCGVIAPARTPSPDDTGTGVA